MGQALWLASGAAGQERSAPARLAEMEALMAVEPLSRADEMNAFYAEINQKGLDALWRHQGPPGESGGPRAPFAPYLWRWSMVRPYMQRTTELVQPGADAERRVLTLNNPTSLPMQSTTHTVSA